MNMSRYIKIIYPGDGEYSIEDARRLLGLPGYAHARDLIERGAIPRAVTIDGHYVLELDDDSWVIDAPRSGGGVEHIGRNWRAVAEDIEANLPVSMLIGSDDEA